MFDYRQFSRTKSPLFSSIVFAVVIFIIYADGIVYNLSLQYSATSSSKGLIPEFTRYKDVDGQRITVVVPNLGALSSRKDEEESDRREKFSSENQQLPLISSEKSQGANNEVLDSEGQISSIKPPLHLTREERVAWFKERLPRIEIFKSNNLTRQFHGRVLEFFNDDCEVRFFMTWISPASSFGRREVLAMESVFKSHPHGCLMIISTTMDSPLGYNIMKPLLDRGFKLAAVTPDLPLLFKNTPAEIWLDEIQSGSKDPGEIPLAQNLSNLIRLAVLYKYGGVYLDTDFIVLKSFKELSNSIGAQAIDVTSKNWTRLNNAVLIFDMNHPLLLSFMKEFAATFDGNKWGHNGPYLVSRVVHEVEGKPGYNFTVLSPTAFYPVGWTRIQNLFSSPKTGKDSRWVEAKFLQLSNETYGLHLWNKQSRRFPIEKGSVIEKLISDHCVICDQASSRKKMMLIL